MCIRDSAKTAGKTLAIDAAIIGGLGMAGRGIDKIRSRKSPPQQQESADEFSEDRTQRARQVASFANRSGKGLAVDAATFYGVGMAGRGIEKGVNTARAHQADRQGNERPSDRQVFKSGDKYQYPGI